jgi:hypothetical protein
VYMDADGGPSPGHIAEMIDWPPDRFVSHPDDVDRNFKLETSQSQKSMAVWSTSSWSALKFRATMKQPAYRQLVLINSSLPGRHVSTASRQPFGAHRGGDERQVVTCRSVTAAGDCRETQWAVADDRIKRSLSVAFISV